MFPFLFIQSCANSELGRKLSDSFDSPVESDETRINKEELKTKKSKKEKKQNFKKRETKSQQDSFLNNQNSKDKATSPKPARVNSQVKAQKKNRYKPQPYRIVIKISESNPSAPAEAVTRVLRDAGVVFEVEKIERFDNTITNNLQSIQRGRL